MGDCAVSDLETVKKGDTVTVFPLPLAAPYERQVQRVTKHQIILTDGDRFTRHNGREYGYNGWRMPPFIAIGVKAEQVKKDRAADILRYRAAQALNIPVPRLNRETVTKYRKACDKAEAALRELGRWE